ncbi:MAG: FMN-binding glutamate synthase family protein [Rhodospirillales bacterium]|nr:FMN-binding glutamate synthase family protein [Rhodospirillales bacterium]
MNARILFFIISIIISLATIILARFWPSAHWFFIVILPSIGLGIYDMVQRKHTILRVYPVVGHLRFLLELIRPEIQQYFVESDTNGMPISREFRALVYQRAKGQNDLRPFGTLFDVYRNGHEWVDHSLAPKPVQNHNPRIRFGGSECSQPYDASPLNISAMSFGALSQHAVMALNKGAKIGGFAHNTGEGGLSPYHLKHGGDLTWQIGTGYFGCRTIDGNFDEMLFSEKAGSDAVKMIEIKLSQGAKPGHGGILPAVKLTQEIADIRHVPMGHDVISPPAHTAFESPVGLLEFVAKLRERSGGKPVGFKLCIGRKSEFLAICKAMLETGLTPDFITVDGAEGGTGAAPIEFANSVGTPLREGLNFVHNSLIGVGLRDQIRIMASGKAISAFHMMRLMASGADTVNVARAMMFALGCIQSLKCHQDTCPTGVATQNPARYQSLDIDDKADRVANYHASMIENLMELVAATGLNDIDELRPWHINRRINGTETRNYAELYPCIMDRCLLSASDIPEAWQHDWGQAESSRW